MRWKARQEKRDEARDQRGKRQQVYIDLCILGHNPGLSLACVDVSMLQWYAGSATVVDRKMSIAGSLSVAPVPSPTHALTDATSRSCHCATWSCVIRPALPAQEVRAGLCSPRACFWPLTLTCGGALVGTLILGSPPSSAGGGKTDDCPLALGRSQSVEGGEAAGSSKAIAAEHESMA